MKNPYKVITVILLVVITFVILPDTIDYIFKTKGTIVKHDSNCVVEYNFPMGNGQTANITGTIKIHNVEFIKNTNKVTFYEEHVTGKELTINFDKLTEQDYNNMEDAYYKDK